MSWHSFKSFSPSCTSKIMFKKILKRSGKFLTQLSLQFSDMDIKESESILSIIANECTNLQQIDLGHYCFNGNVAKLFQPNFHKVEVFKCNINDLDDENLHHLFSKNEKLKHLKIKANCKDRIKVTFLDALSRDCLTHLELNGVEIDGIHFNKVIIH